MPERKRIFRGDRLREMRRKRQLTQDELADRLGFGQSQMNKYENGKSDPTPEVLVRLAKELAVTSDWLLGLVDDPEAFLQEQELTPAERKLLSAFRRGDFKELVRLAAERTTPEA